VNSFHNFLEHFFLRQSSHHKVILIYHRLRHAHNLVLLGQMRKLRGLYHIGGDKLTLHGQLIRQANCLGTIGSGGGNEHLEVYFFVDPLQCFLGLGL
jgi:hypothetical protein